MQDVVNEEFFEELANDYEFNSKAVKKWWNILTSSFDFIQSDDIGAICLTRVVNYRNQSYQAHKRDRHFKRSNVTKDIIRAVKETYPIYFDQPIEIKIDEEKILVYSKEELDSYQQL